jgi:superoxide dismutase, Fe-Mn family
MDRKDFLKIGALTGASTIIGTNNAFAQNLTKNNMDKLVDAN